MTKEDMVAMLKRSVEEWNAWREENPKTIIDLSDLNLRNIFLKNVNLTKANLRDVNFSFATLNNANLSYANLSGANFRKTILSGGNLRNTILTNANLDNTSLDNADLSNANLRNAILCNTHLSSTKIQNIIFQYTKVSQLNMTNIKSIEMINHKGPTYLDATTFQKSQGQIPEIFLKGCGLSDWEIESVKLYNPKLTPTEVTDILYKMDELRNEKPIQFHNLFISYNHKDAPFADALEKYLDAKGIRFWRDVHDAPAGRLDKIVLREMKDRVVLLLFSKNSANSDWVEFEIENARKLEKEQGRDVLCPIAIDDAWQSCGWSPILINQIKKYHVLDFSNWEDAAMMERQFGKLLKGLDLFYKK